jgi:hypothetical protein
MHSTQANTYPRFTRVHACTARTTCAAGCSSRGSSLQRSMLPASAHSDKASSTLLLGGPAASGPSNPFFGPSNSFFVGTGHSCFRGSHIANASLSAVLLRPSAPRSAAGLELGEGENDSLRLKALAVAATSATSLVTSFMLRPVLTLHEGILHPLCPPVRDFPGNSKRVSARMLEDVHTATVGFANQGLQKHRVLHDMCFSGCVHPGLVSSKDSGMLHVLLGELCALLNCDGDFGSLLFSASRHGCQSRGCATIGFRAKMHLEPACMCTSKYINCLN